MRSQRAVWAALFIGTVGAVALVPRGVAVVGAVQGGLAALLAIGLVLVYQAHRFLHLGQAALGAVAGSVVTYLVAHAGWHYWFAYPAGLALGALVGVASGMLLAERLADASRVVVLVCSIGSAFAFGAAQIGISLATGAVLRTEVPIGVSIDLFPVRLSGAHVLAVLTVAAALVSSWFLLRRTDTGLRIRALATGPVHARRMGIDPHRTWRRLWAFTGLLAAAAGIAAQPLVGTSFDAGPTLGPLLLALAAAVVGRMRDLPLTVASAVALGVAHQAVSWHVPIAATADVLLVAVIAAVLLLRSDTGRPARSDPAAWRFVRSIRPVDARHHLSLRIVQLSSITAVTIVTIAAIQRSSAGDAQRIGTIATFALAAIAVHVSATFGGRLSLGHWAIAGVGAVTASIIGPASPAGAFLAVAAGAALAVLLSGFFLRGGALGYITATFAVAAAFPVLHAHAAPAIGADTHFGPFDLSDPASTAGAIVVVVAFVVVCVGAFRRSRTGTSALAVREDPRLAAVHGVAIVWTTVVVEGFAGAIAGGAGFLYLWSQGTVHPDAFAAVRSLELVAMAVVGGLGSVAGAVTGATLVQGAQLFASGPLYLLGTAAGVLVITVWLRGGLASLVDIARTPRARREAPAGRKTPAGAAERFADAPADATRKARKIPAVRRAAFAALLAATATGWVTANVAAGRPPDATVWIAIAFAAFAAAAAAAGFRLHATFGASLVTLIATAAALRWPWAGVFVIGAAGWTFGSLLRSVTADVPSALRSATAGWVTIQALAGAAVGVAVWLVDPHPVVPLAFAGVLCAIAAGRPDRGSPATHRHAPDDGVHIDHLTVQLGEAPILRDLDLHVAPGQIVGIAGANGSGKSTLLRCIAGEIRPGSGSIRAGAADATTSSPDELARRGVLLADANRGSNGELSVHDNIGVATMLATGHREAMQTGELAELIHPRLGEAANDRAAVLSGGERRLLALVQTLIVAPRVLLADELGRGLADEQLIVLGEALRELAARGCAVIVVEHDPRFLTFVADKVMHLHDGALRDSASLVLTTERTP